MKVKMRRKDLSLPMLAAFLVIGAGLIQLHNYIMSGSFFQFDQLHHESFSLGLLTGAVIAILLYIFRKEQ